MRELRFRFTLLGAFLSFFLHPNASAFPGGDNPFELIDGLGATWEISVPPASEIKDQGKYPYCGLYAMSSFLELWSRGGNPSFAYPSMDPAFLALGYNRVVGAGNRGTHPLWLAISTQIFGAIPKGSRFTGNEQWPLRNWSEAHDDLIERNVTDPLLRGRYTHSITAAQFTGRQYLTSATRIDFSQIVGISSNFNEPTLPSNEPAPPARLRAGSYAQTVGLLARLSQKTGIRGNFIPVDVRQFYLAVKKQLYARRPVMLSINAGLTKTKFSGYRMIEPGDLVQVGQGKNYSHAVVAVAHCDKDQTRDPICRLFGRYLQRSSESECIAIQNSWGPEVHERGYVCMAPSAFARIAKAALISNSVLRP